MHRRFQTQNSTVRPSLKTWPGAIAQCVRVLLNKSEGELESLMPTHKPNMATCTCNPYDWEGGDG